MPYETITYETPEKGIGVLSLNRPKAYNAVNYKMVEELESFWNERLHDLETAVILLKGSGEKGFCAGLDLKQMAELAPSIDIKKFYAIQMRMARLNLAMRRAPQPIVCAVHGAAYGIGFSFVLASDIRVITTDARLCAAYINVGMGGADMACSYFLPRMIGAGRAYEFMYTGDSMSAQEALSLGLVSRIIEGADLYDTAMAYAKKLMTKNPMGLRLTKEAINANIDASGLENALQIEDRNQTLLSVGVLLGK